MAVALVTKVTMLPLLIATRVGGLLAEEVDRPPLVIGPRIVQDTGVLALGAVARDGYSARVR